MKGVILLAPPWPGSGTANIVAAQIAAYREMGFNVYLLLEPLGTWNSVYSRKWKNIVQNMPFSSEIIVGYPAAPIGVVNWISYSFSRRCDDAITEVANYAASGRLPSSLTDFIQKHEIEHIRVNHVFGMRLAKRVSEIIIANRRCAFSILLDTHDIQSDNFSLAKRRNRISNRIEAGNEMLAGELSLAKEAATLIHISKSDYNFFVSALPDRRHFYIPPTLHPEIERQLVVDRRDVSMAELDFVYFGNDNPGNLSSVRWLLKEVFPYFQNEIPNLKIIGTIKLLFKKEEPQLFERYASLFIGDVPSTLPWYRMAKAVLTYSTIGTGASIKFIEALCAGKITITNSIGIRGGFSAEGSEDCIIADSPNAFASAMMEIISGTKRYSPKNASIYDNHFSNGLYNKAITAICAQVN